jgi:hypothetical protein
VAQPDYNFEYSWEDLKPVRPLFGLHAGGAGVGPGGGVGVLPRWSKLGRDVAFVWAVPPPRFLGYLLGLWVQTVMMPGSLGRNRVMVQARGNGWPTFFSASSRWCFPGWTRMRYAFRSMLPARPGDRP